MSGPWRRMPEADNTDEVVEVGHTSARLPQPPKPVQNGTWPFFFLCRNPDLGCPGQACRGRQGVGWASTQQCASKSWGHFYPAIPSAALALQNECELWGPLSLWFSSAAIPAATFLKIKCTFHPLAEGRSVSCLPVALPPAVHCCSPSSPVSKQHFPRTHAPPEELTGILGSGKLPIRDIAISFTRQDSGGSKQGGKRLFVYFTCLSHYFSFSSSLSPSSFPLFFLSPSCLTCLVGIKSTTTFFFFSLPTQGTF